MDQRNSKKLGGDAPQRLTADDLVLATALEAAVSAAGRTTSLESAMHLILSIKVRMTPQLPCHAFRMTARVYRL